MALPPEPLSRGEKLIYASIGIGCAAVVALVILLAVFG